MPKIPHILTLLTISLISVPGLVGPPCEQGNLQEQGILLAGYERVITK